MYWLHRVHGSSVAFFTQLPKSSRVNIFPMCTPQASASSWTTVCSGKVSAAQQDFRVAEKALADAEKAIAKCREARESATERVSRAHASKHRAEEALQRARERVEAARAAAAEAEVARFAAQEKEQQRVQQVSSVTLLESCSAK